jgi:hypothetical protein
MAELTYYDADGVQITGSAINDGDAIYPMTAVTSVEIDPVFFEAAKMERRVSRATVVLYIVSGLGLLLLGCAIAQLGTTYCNAVAIAGLAGIGFIALGWRRLKRDSVAADSPAPDYRWVTVTLASGERHQLRANGPENAALIQEAVRQALSAEGAGGSSVAEELSKLAGLRDAGVLTDDDWERAKDLYLGKRPSEREAAIQQLKQLHSLQTSGVLSESEFRMKKWDVLSKPK